CARPRAGRTARGSDAPTRLARPPRTPTPNHRDPPERALVGYRLTYVDLDDLAHRGGSRDLKTAARQRQRHNFRAESVPVVFDQAVGERSPPRVCSREADQPQARDLAAT